MRYLFISLPLFMFGLAGCAVVKTSDVQETNDAGEAFESPLAADLDASMVDWYESLARINFVAVLPVRSDVKVGDIYLTWDYKPAEAAQERLQRMVKRQLWESSIVPAAAAARHSLLDHINLPFVAVGSRIESDLIDIVPSNISSKTGSFQIRPTAGRIESQPLQDILNWLKADDADDIGVTRLKQEYWRNLSAVPSSGKQAVWLHVVSEILYMQSLDIRLSGELDLDLPENVEASITADMAEADDNGEDGEPVYGQAAADPDQVRVESDSSADNEITVVQETNAFTRALAINKILEAQGLNDNFGVVTRLVFIDDDEVVLRTSMPRPLAIGVRGLRLQVNPLTGEILRIQAWQP
ncbi:MAG: hypothetical protein QNJ85_03355 [Gammaproteobacteria bacterium]|nr:hypothetical protein [Gammaproteobacteria bacterium]